MYQAIYVYIMNNKKNFDVEIEDQKKGLFR